MSERSLTLTSANDATTCVELVHAFVERLAGAEHGGVRLHHALHVEADLRGADRALGIAQPIDAAHREIARVLRAAAGAACPA